MKDSFWFVLLHMRAMAELENIVGGHKYLQGEYGSVMVNYHTFQTKD